MPAVTVEEFLEAHEDFSAFEEEKIEKLLSDVEELYCPASVWGDGARQRRGIMLRTACILECQRQQWARTSAIGTGIAQGQPGADSPITGSELDQNVYGAEFKALRRSVVGIGTIAG